jgi:PAS domain S-box-containing protein
MNPTVIGSLETKERSTTRDPATGPGRSEAPRHSSPTSESERHFRQIIDLLPAAIYTTDAEGRLTHFNPAAAALSGRTPQLGSDQWCVSLRLYRPDGTPLPHDQCPMAIALREGRAVLGAELIVERPDGTRRWVEPSPQPLLDEAGRVCGGVNMLVDITDRKDREQSAALLGAIVDSSDDAIVSKNLDGIITSWNAGAQRLFGYSAEEAIGQPMLLIIPAERQHEEPEILARLRRGEQVDHFETVRVRKDGTRLDISLTISPVRDTSGRIVGASKIARDITEDKRVHEELRLADRRKSEFLAMLAHELRNPLAPIQNTVEILARIGGEDGDLAPLAGVLQRQVNHMIRLVDDLLDVSRISSGKIKVLPSPVELAPIARQAVEATRPLAERKRHELVVELPQEPIRLHADGARIMQVIGNLLTNACKYTEPGGRILLKVSCEGPHAVIRVQDNGIGIAAEDLPSIFEMFSQIDTSLERSQGGMGIGLSLVKKLVELHGGSVEAHSAGLGHGSQFIVRLPIMHEPVRGA